ncbi:hypothetical protein NQ315_011526 [Exocentrus adspersus]|uniref:Immunoglobulin-like beta-sandwich domain-containing protein n=1 Tax=Exocentrus adspersus TaxID=1586481 RepID=A0AAV8VV24_9CUCU|nr:hypothetical protein NQ315_011526 [Exocentrus adspersus]
MTNGSGFVLFDLELQRNIMYEFTYVAWVRAEDQTVLSLHTKVVTHNSRVSVTHDDMKTWKLRIRPVKESDRGCYLCQINTPVLKSQMGCLDVFDPPHNKRDETHFSVRLHKVRIAGVTPLNSARQ